MKLNVASYLHPESGPEGESLYLDSAYVGRADADRLFVLISGTHGPEGFCGSAAQIGLLRSLEHAPQSPNVGVLLIHAHNPFGFAWGIRQTQENVDLNRNFLDHRAPPENDVYDFFARQLGDFPDEWSAEFLAHYRQAREATAAEFGEAEARRGLGYGQYRHPAGFHFGGRRETWSRKTSEDILAACAPHTRVVVAIDVHTGLGRYGYGELLSLSGEETGQFRRSREIFGGSVRSMPDGDSVADYSEGNVSSGIPRIFERSVAVAHALEFGTFEGDALQEAKAKCQWLMSKSALQHAESVEIRRRYQAIFYPERDDWKEMVWTRTMMVARQALDWLSTASPGNAVPEGPNGRVCNERVTADDI